MSKHTLLTQDSIDEQEPPTCRNDSEHCPVDNPGVADTRLECFECFCEL